MLTRNPNSRGRLAIVLAAGKGSRMRPARPKVLRQLAGRSMLAYVLTVLVKAEAREAYSAIVAPLKIGAGTYTGWGPVITKDVPANALGVPANAQSTNPARLIPLGKRTGNKHFGDLPSSGWPVWPPRATGLWRALGLWQRGGRDLCAE